MIEWCPAGSFGEIPCTCGDNNCPNQEFWMACDICHEPGHKDADGWYRTEKYSAVCSRCIETNGPAI